MEIQGKLSRSLTATLAYGSCMGTIIYSFVDVTYKTGKPFWIAILLGILLTIPFALWILILGSYQQKGNLFDLLGDGLGIMTAKLFLLLYTLISMASSACMLGLSASSINIFFLPRTPMYVIILILVVMGAIFANSGLKYLSRVVAVLAVLGTVNYFIGFSMSFIKNFHLELILPIMDSTIPKFLKGVYISCANDMEGLLFLMLIVDFIPQTKKHYFSVMKGILTWSLVLSVATLISEGIVSQEVLSEVSSAGISVASNIRFGSFFSGLEVFVMITYQYIAAFKTALSIFCCWIALRKVFGVPNGKPLLIITAAGIFAAAAFLDSYNRAFFLSLFLGNYIIFPFVLLFLLLCSISVLIKKARERKSADEN